MRGHMPRWIRQHKRRGYIVAAFLSTPLWVKARDFNELQRRANDLTKLLGKQHVLDHIIPIRHHSVCGLTVPWNIQVLTSKQNSDKNGKWNPYQLDLFEDSEQFKLL